MTTKKTLAKHHLYSGCNQCNPAVSVGIPETDFVISPRSVQCFFVVAEHRHHIHEVLDFYSASTSERLTLRQKEGFQFGISSEICMNALHLEVPEAARTTRGFEALQTNQDQRKGSMLRLAVSDLLVWRP